MKQVFQCENGEIEFDNEKDFERYLKGDKPKLELIKDNKYKAIYEP